jgi:putative transcriptional regulator
LKILVSNKYFKPEKGKVLLSEPFLQDINFRRTAVFLTEHNNQGSIGFIINKPLAEDTDTLLPGLLNYNFPLFFGGPVENNTIHFIHRNNYNIKNSVNVTNDIFWSGDIEQINQILLTNPEARKDFKFFIGYSGWSAGQLEEELKHKSWWVANAYTETIFTDDIEEIWPTLVKTLGKNFIHFANPPEDYILN